MQKKFLVYFILENFLEFFKVLKNLINVLIQIQQEVKQKSLRARQLDGFHVVTLDVDLSTGVSVQEFHQTGSGVAVAEMCTTT